MNRERSQRRSTQNQRASTPKPASVGKERHSRRKLRALFLLFLLALTVSLIIMTLVRKSSEVEINVKASRMSFKITDESATRLFNSVKTNSLAVSTFKKISLGTGILEISREMDKRTGEPINWRRANRPVNFENVLIPQERYSNIMFEAVTLNRIDVPLGTAMTLSWVAEEPGTVKLSFDSTAAGEIAGGKTLNFSCTGCRLQDDPSTGAVGATLHFRLTNQREDGNIVHFVGSDNTTIVGLNIPSDIKPKEQNIKLTDKVNFTDLREARQISTIIEGKIKFVEVGEQIEVGEGLFVNLDDLKNATLRTISIDKGINVTLYGTVGKLLTGDEGNMKNRNPSYLKWVYVREKWILVVNALLVIVPLVLGGIGWWRNFPKES